MNNSLNCMHANTSVLDARPVLCKANGCASLFPQLLQLAYIMFTVPVQSATAERGFSQHDNLETRLRNS